MGTKLTLRLDNDLIKSAKRIAKAKGVSLSMMVSDYFKTISSFQRKEEVESPVLSEIAGILSPGTDNKRLKKSYRKHLEEKYL